MTKIKKNDFIEIDFIGRIKGSNHVFDCTNEDIAKKNNLFNKELEYKPLIICIGERNIIPGLDDALLDKEIGKNYVIEVNAEKAFGKKDQRLVRLVNTNVFLKNNINPIPGLQVNIDNLIGTIRTVTGGRTIVDFNNPLAGRDVVYEVKINKKIEGINEKLKSCIRFNIGLNEKLYEVRLKNNSAEIILGIEIPKEVQDIFIKKIKPLISELKDIKFVKKDVEEFKKNREKKKILENN